MISRIVIEKLHNLYNYDILIPDGQRVSIITGPNGYGKTTLLKIISHLLACKFWFFCFLKFKSITVYFRNGMSIVIKTEEVELKEQPKFSDVINMKEQIRVELRMSDEAVIDSLVLGTNYIARLYRKYSPVYSGRSFEGFDLEDTLEKEYILESDTYLSDNGKNIRMFLQERSCHFVQEQRLISAFSSVRNLAELRRKTTNSNESEINIIAGKLKGLFAENQMRFAAKSQEIDATFIKRLIHEEHSSYGKDVFGTKLDTLKQKMSDYQKYGLVPQTDILEEYPQELQNVLSLYIDDMEAKLSVFDEFYTKLSLLDRFVSGKSLSNKRIELNEKKGISVYNDNGEEIPLNKLSGGEQNLIILCFQLVFTTKRSSLLLIDEPENSLHMAWLSLMLEDYQKMADELKCQIIIATHSPVFINSQWNITFDLYLNNAKKA